MMEKNLSVNKIIQCHGVKPFVIDKVENFDPYEDHKYYLRKHENDSRKITNRKMP